MKDKLSESKFEDFYRKYSLFEGETKKGFLNIEIRNFKIGWFNYLN